MPANDFYMRPLYQNIFRLILTSLSSLLFTGCGLVFGLFYKDWRSEVAYRSSTSKRNYYVVEGVTQSHCGCSDIVVKHYKNKKKDFTFYYGGGLFPAKKYIYQKNPDTKNIDTVIYVPTTNTNFTIPLDSLDKEILRHIDSLILHRPKGSGLIYQVKRHEYKGFVIERNVAD